MQILDYWYVFVIVFIGALGIVIYSALSPMRYMLKGNYAKAISKMHLQLISETYQKSPMLRAALLLNLANCYNRQGDLDQSLSTLDEIDLSHINDQRFLFGYYGLYATNLMLVDCVSERAAHMLHKAYAILQVPEILPLLAYSEVSRHNFERAEDYLNQYLQHETAKDIPKGKFVWSLKETTLVFDKFTLEIENKFYIGRAYLKLGKKESAVKYLTQAAKNEYPNYYSEKAREVLKGI